MRKTFFFLLLAGSLAISGQALARYGENSVPHGGTDTIGTDYNPYGTRTDDNTGNLTNEPGNENGVVGSYASPEHNLPSRSQDNASSSGY